MTDKTKLIRRMDVMTADMNGSAVTMDIMTGKYYNMGEVGGVIWNMLSTEKTIDELVNALTKEYSVSAAQCKKDITPFLQSLVDKGLLIEK